MRTGGVGVCYISYTHTLWALHCCCLCRKHRSMCNVVATSSRWTYWTQPISVRLQVSCEVLSLERAVRPRASDTVPSLFAGGWQCTCWLRVRGNAFAAWSLTAFPSPKIKSDWLDRQKPKWLQRRIQPDKTARQPIQTMVADMRKFYVFGIQLAIGRFRCISDSTTTTTSSRRW